MPHEAVPLPTRRLPVWAMGLANMPTGFVYGFLSTAMGILLVAHGVSLERVSRISFVAFSPSFWAWTLAPAIDVRFSKRTYAYALAILSASFLAGAVLSLNHLDLFTALLTAACVAITLYAAAVSAWFPDILTDAEFNSISGWANLANLGGAGVFSLTSIVLIRRLPLPLAAAVLALMVLAPAFLLLGFPAPRQPEGTLRANFAAMARDLRLILRGTRIWVGLLIFLSPVCFALGNLFSSMGNDFHISEAAVTALNGPSVAVVCSLGCLLAIPLCRILPRRVVYLMAGVGGAAFAIPMGLLPHTLTVYAVGMLGYNMLQGFNYTAFGALSFEIVGPNNALAGTMMAMLTASANLPISIMTAIDGRVHTTHGLNAMFFVDSAAAVGAAALLLLVILPWTDRWVKRRDLAGALR